MWVEKSIRVKNNILTEVRDLWDLLGSNGGVQATGDCDQQAVRVYQTKQKPWLSQFTNISAKLW